MKKINAIIAILFAGTILYGYCESPSLNSDEHNIISYSYPQCLEYFSAGQGERMRQHIAFFDFYQPKLIPTCVYIQNETFLNVNKYIDAVDKIVIGKNVTNGTIGDVNILSINNEFVAGNEIILKDESIINPNIMGNCTIKINKYINGTDRSIYYKEKILGSNYKMFLCHNKWHCADFFFENNKLIEYYIEKDTLINDRFYKKITNKYIDVGFPGSFKHNNNYLYLYEDIATQKVYNYDLYDKQVKILYDFDLKIGDKCPANNEFTLTKIDTVKIGFNDHRKFIFSTSEGKLTIIWIEGIGNITDPFFPNS